MKNKTYTYHYYVMRNNNIHADGLYEIDKMMDTDGYIELRRQIFDKNNEIEGFDDKFTVCSLTLVGEK
jgi:hypothetical protein